MDRFVGDISEEVLSYFCSKYHYYCDCAITVQVSACSRTNLPTKLLTEKSAQRTDTALLTSLLAERVGWIHTKVLPLSTQTTTSQCSPHNELEIKSL